MELARAPVLPLQPSSPTAASRVPTAPPLEPARRLFSLDIVRGLTMLIMTSGIMYDPAAAAQFAVSRIRP